MNLSEDEKLQSSSIKAKRYLISRLEKLREQNDAAMPKDDRDTLIGEIKGIKSLLKFFCMEKVDVPVDKEFND